MNYKKHTFFVSIIIIFIITTLGFATTLKETFKKSLFLSKNSYLLVAILFPFLFEGYLSTMYTQILDISVLMTLLLKYPRKLEYQSHEKLF